VDWLKDHIVALLSGAFGGLLAWFRLRELVAVQAEQMKALEKSLSDQNDEILRLRERQHDIANSLTTLQLEQSELRRKR
jgi:hypothetical protein